MFSAKYVPFQGGKSTESYSLDEIIYTSKSGAHSPLPGPPRPAGLACGAACGPRRRGRVFRGVQPGGDT